MAEHPDKAEILKLRFFSGLEIAEVAATLGLSVRSVERLPNPSPRRSTLPDKSLSDRHPPENQDPKNGRGHPSW
ncbi:MAG: hypothetical protein J0M24_18835 [Verrucomicrobia bacterium]|nr:hypothetical protein [Verrucomicrobiota bacterium]